MARSRSRSCAQKPPIDPVRNAMLRLFSRLSESHASRERGTSAPGSAAHNRPEIWRVAGLQKRGKHETGDKAAHMRPPRDTGLRWITKRRGDELGRKPKYNQPD